MSGEYHNVTNHPSEDFHPTWSRDGNYIYFASDRTGEIEVWKIPLNGNDVEAIQITYNGGDIAFESADGKWLYFHKPKSGIWRLPLTGGQAKLILERQLRRDFWALVKHGIYFFDCSSLSSLDREIKFLSFNTKQILPFVKIISNGSIGLTVSSDEQTLLYSQSDSRRQGDIWLVENW
jgi:hypothetical protein